MVFIKNHVFQLFKQMYMQWLEVGQTFISHHWCTRHWSVVDVRIIACTHLRLLYQQFFTSLSEKHIWRAIYLCLARMSAGLSHPIWHHRSQILRFTYLVHPPRKKTARMGMTCSSRFANFWTTSLQCFPDITNQSALARAQKRNHDQCWILREFVHINSQLLGGCCVYGDLIQSLLNLQP